MDARATEAALQEVADMMPEPLYETAGLDGDHLCLVCGQNRASTALLSPGRSEAIVPLCTACSSNWRIYGYLILKRIRPLALLAKMAGFFVLNPLRRHVVWRDLQSLMRWQKKMARLRGQAKASSSVQDKR